MSLYYDLSGQTCGQHLLIVSCAHEGKENPIERPHKRRLYALVLADMFGLALLQYSWM